MARNLAVLLSLLLLFPCLNSSAFAASEPDVAVTVYNQGMGLVRELRRLDLGKGVQEYSYDGVAAQILPTSVRFEAGGVEILEQNFEYDLISQQALMQKYLGQQVDLVLEEGLVSGKLLSVQGGIIVEEDDGGVRMLQNDAVKSVRFPELPEGLIIKPTLRWLLDSQVSGSVKTELAYLSRNLDWEASYVAVVNANDDGLELSGWVQLTNESGADYRDALLKLIAGDVQFEEESPYAPTIQYERAMMATDGMAKGFEEKSFFEYHLYTLPRRVDILDNQVKQIRLIDPATTPVTRTYVFEPWRGNDIEVKLEFTNSQSAGLGIPLPAGLVRMYKLDPDDNSMQLIGEDRIDHTPRDEKISLKTGNAFDIVAERKQTNSSRITPNVRQDDYQVELRNRKESAVEVIVRERFRGDWRIVAESLAGRKIDATTYEWVVPVAAGEEKTITYTVRVQ